MKQESNQRNSTVDSVHGNWFWQAIASFHGRIIIRLIGEAGLFDKFSISQEALFLTYPRYFHCFISSGLKLEAVMVLMMHAIFFIAID